LLLVSSATFHKAGKALLKDKNSDSQKWLFITAVLGIIFLLIQGFSELLKSYWAAKKGEWPGEKK